VQVEREFTNKISMKFKLIPAGEFLMGQKDIAEPIHKVKLTKPFYLGIYPVTQKEWETVMGTNPSLFKWYDFPVTNVSWNDCQEFIKKLTELEFGPKKESSKYRLPTEAEWEYACRSGSTSMFYFDHKIEKLDDYIWHLKNSKMTHEVLVEKGILNKSLVEVTKTCPMPHPVGKLKPNKFGLYDMHGNVFEWCSDWFSAYSSELVIDPIGTPKESIAKSRIFRGGSYLNFAGYGSSAHRDSRIPSYKSEVVGVRLVRMI
jgi:formylglycine-generating enzyme required for sulfatase activity